MNTFLLTRVPVAGGVHQRPAANGYFPDFAPSKPAFAVPKKYTKRERESIEIRKLFGDPTQTQRERDLVHRAYLAGQAKANACCSEEGGDPTPPANVWTDDVDMHIAEATGLKLTTATIIEEIKSGPAVSVAKVESNVAATEKQLTKLPLGVLQMDSGTMESVESAAMIRDYDPAWGRDGFPRGTAPALPEEEARSRAASSSLSLFPAGHDSSSAAAGKIPNPRVIKYKSLSPLLSPSRAAAFYGHFR